MMRIIELSQGSLEWHEHRAKYLGASEISAVLGVSPWEKPKDLFLKKIGYVKENISSDKQKLFDKGHSKEIIARDKYELQTLKKFHPMVILNDGYPYLSASLDGLSDDGELIEIKYLGLEDYLNVVLGIKIPDKYIPQVQCQMLLAGVDKMTFIGINESDDIATMTVEKDSLFICDMISKADIFWGKVLTKNWD